MNNERLNILSRALEHYWKRNKLINSNIANVNTPDYKRKDISFGKILENKHNGPEEGYITDAKHIKINSAGGIEQKAQRRMDSLKARMDGNNVDLDIETAELAKNTIRYNATTDQITNHFKRMKSVIGEGRR